MKKAFQDSTGLNGQVSARISGFTRIILLFSCVATTGAIQAGVFEGLENKLRPAPISEAAWEDHFGETIAVSGDRLAVGVPHARGTDSWRQGAVDVYRRTFAGGWEHEAALTAPAAQEWDQFGQSLAIDGDTLVVAAMRDVEDPGDKLVMLYVFRFSDGEWREEAAFEPLWTNGWHVSLALRGDQIACGVISNGELGETADAVYLFHRGLSGWILEQTLVQEQPQRSANYGWSVALDGNRLLVTAPTAQDEGDQIWGHAYIYERNANAWILTGHIVPPGGTEAWGHFGDAAGLHGDVAVIGQPCAEYYIQGGGVHVYQRAGAEWNYSTTLTPGVEGDWRYSNNLACDGRRLFMSLSIGELNPTAHSVGIYERLGDEWIFDRQVLSPQGGDDRFGAAMASDNETLFVGAPYYDGLAGGEQGAVYVLGLTEPDYPLDALLCRRDELLSPYDYLGDSVAVEGDMMLAGAPADCGEAGCGQGSVYVFLREDDGWRLARKLYSPAPEPNAQFGSSVAASGNRWIIGEENARSPMAPYSGAAYVFRREGAELILEGNLYAVEGRAGDRFGEAVAIHGDRAIVGAYYADITEGEEAGAAYIFVCMDGTWTQQARLTASDPLENAYFGISVSIDAERAIVGAYQASDRHRGAAYVFSRTNGVWSEEARLEPGASFSAWFGIAVAIEGDTIAVGASHAQNHEGGGIGRVFIYSHIGTEWTSTGILRSDSPAASTYFGSRLFLDGNWLAVGAKGEDVSGHTDQGAAYLFYRDGDSWRQRLRVAASDGHDFQYYGGQAVALDGRHLVVGAPFDGNGSGEMTGAVYAYDVACAGDVDGDWIVDIADLQTLLVSYGATNDATRAMGDLDGDADVDLTDLAALLGAYGDTCP